MLEKKEIIDNYIEKKEKEWLTGQVNNIFESIGIDKSIKNPLWGKEKIEKYADLYLKETKTFIEQIQLQFMELKLSIVYTDLSKFKKDLDSLNTEIVEGEVNDVWAEHVWINNIDITTEQQNILDTVNNYIDVPVTELRKNNEAMHCRRWADKIYKKAWYDSWKREVIYQDGDHYSAKWEQLNNNELIDSIENADWLYIHNWNWVDKKWDHSGLFMWRADESKWIANIASYPGSSSKANIKKYNLKKNQIRHISRPKMRQIA